MFRRSSKISARRSARRSISAVAVIVYVVAALLAAPAQAAGIGSPDTECRAAGFDFGIERWGYSSGWSLTDSGTKAADYLIVVSGDDQIATWTATPGVDGVLAKAGSDSSGGGTAILGGGTGGTISVSGLRILGGLGLSHVTFCGNNVVVPPVTAPSATASPSACDTDGMTGPNEGAILVTVKDIDPSEVIVTIDGEDALVGSNLVQAGTHAVLVTDAAGKTILSEDVTVLDCTTLSPITPSATASPSACDTDGMTGPNKGAILVAVEDIDPSEVIVTIDGEDALVGSNLVQAGTHAVLVTDAAGKTILSEDVTVLDCSQASGPLAASVAVGLGDCVFGTQSLTPVNTAINPEDGATIALTKVGTGVIHTFSGSGGSASLTPGSYTWMATPMPGFELSGLTGDAFVVNSCQVAPKEPLTPEGSLTPAPVVITTAAPAPPHVLGDAATIAAPAPIEVLGTQIVRGQPLPATGPTVPMSHALALAIAVILLGFTLDAAGSGRNLIRHAPRHLAREWMWELNSKTA